MVPSYLFALRSRYSPQDRTIRARTLNIIPVMVVVLLPSPSTTIEQLLLLPLLPNCRLGHLLSALGRTIAVSREHFLWRLIEQGALETHSPMHSRLQWRRCWIRGSTEGRRCGHCGVESLAPRRQDGAHVWDPGRMLVISEWDGGVVGIMGSTDVVSRAAGQTVGLGP